MPAPQLRSILPAQNFRDDAAAGGSLAAFVDGVLQPVLDLMWEDADRFGLQIDPDLADPNVVSAMLLDLGCPFPSALGLPVAKQRGLVRSLLRAYKKFGTNEALIDVIRALTGISIVEVIAPARVGGWLLGVHVLADSSSTPYDPSRTNFAILGNTTSNAFSFQLVTPRVLTVDEDALIREIVRRVKPAHTHFYGFVLASSVSVPLPRWQLDVDSIDGDAEVG